MQSEVKGFSGCVRRTPLLCRLAPCRAGPLNDPVLIKRQPGPKEPGMKSTLRLVILFLLSLTAGAVAAAEPLAYPETRRVEHTDTYHGTRVADPYRWLEDDVRKS